METLTSTIGALAALFSAISAILLARYGLEVRSRLCWGAALAATTVVASMGGAILQVHPIAPLCVLVIYAAAADATVAALRARWQRAWTTLAHALVWGTHLVCSVFVSSQWSNWIAIGLVVGLASFATLTWPHWQRFRARPSTPTVSGVEPHGEQVLIVSPVGQYDDGFAHKD